MRRFLTTVLGMLPGLYAPVLRAQVDGQPPELVFEPVAQRVVSGDTARFAVSSGLVPSHFRWLKDGEPILNATGSVLTIRNAKPEDQGYYQAVASNAFGQTFSRSVFLHVYFRFPGPGVTDLTFHMAGLEEDAEILAVKRLADGSFVIGGEFTLQGRATGNLARVLLDGKIDEEFNPGGAGPDGKVRALLPLEDGILIGGDFRTYNGVASPYFAKIGFDGVLVRDYGLERLGDLSNQPQEVRVEALAMSADGGILVGGQFKHIGNLPRPNLAKLEPSDGSPIAEWVPQIADGRVLAIDVDDASGKVVIGGGFTVPHPRVAVLLPDGTVDEAFNPGAGADQHVRAVGYLPGGDVVIGGDFRRIDGAMQNFLARLDRNGKRAGFFAPNLNNKVNVILPGNNGEMLVGGKFTAIDGIAVRHLARFRAGGSLDAAFEPWSLDDQVWSLAIGSPGRVLVGGEFGRPHRGLVLLQNDEMQATETHIVKQPQPATVMEGESACLAVIAMGGPELAYQWYRDGTLLERETGSELWLANAAHDDRGRYHVVVRGPSGNVSSAPAMIDVKPIWLGVPRPHRFTYDQGSEVLAGATRLIPVEVDRPMDLKQVSVELDLRHPATDALDIDLLAPEGPVVELFDGDFKYGRDLFRTGFDDAAPDEILTAQPPFVGTYRPEERLSDFAGRPAAGTWVLRIRDKRVQGEAGYLRSFNLTLTEAALPVRYESWAAGDPRVDADRDGHPDGLAYAFGERRNVGAYVRGASDRGRTFTYLRWRNPLDIAYRLEVSEDMRVWRVAEPARDYRAESIIQWQSVQQVVVRLESTNRFLRMGVQFLGEG